MTGTFAPFGESLTFVIDPDAVVVIPPDNPPPPPPTVPEPCSLLLLGCGFVALGGRIRARRLQLRSRRDAMLRSERF